MYIRDEDFIAECLIETKINQYFNVYTHTQYMIKEQQQVFP